MNSIRIMPQMTFQLAMFNQAFQFFEEIKEENEKMVWSIVCAFTLISNVMKTWNSNRFLFMNLQILLFLKKILDLCHLDLFFLTNWIKHKIK